MFVYALRKRYLLWMVLFLMTLTSIFLLSDFVHSRFVNIVKLDDNSRWPPSQTPGPPGEDVGVQQTINRADHSQKVNLSLNVRIQIYRNNLQRACHFQQLDSICRKENMEVRENFVLGHTNTNIVRHPVRWNSYVNRLKFWKKLI